MSTYEQVLCDYQDVQFVAPRIADYDLKRQVQGWTVHSGSVYKSGGHGSVDQLYRDGIELGAVQSALVDVDADGEWYVDSSLDLIYLHNGGNDPATTNVIEAGRDWSTLRDEAIKRASDFCRSVIGKPLYRKEGTGVAGTTTKAYDEAVVRAAALISASYLIKPYDPEQAEALEREAYDPIEGTGLLDRIRNGEIALHNEVSLRKGAGIVREVSLNASTTGQIVDTRGYASTEWDVLKVVIETGGTFTAGSASSVTYSVYEGDSTGRKTSKAVDANTITGGFDSGAGGIEIRFSPGVYTAADEWEIEISGDAPETQMGTDNVLIRRV